MKSILLLFAISTTQFAIAQQPPRQAVNAGYTNLVFDDEFDSPNTVSPDGTGNYNWYLTNFTNPDLSLPSYDYSIQNGYLKIDSDASGYSDGLQTASPANTTGAWQHGYFEASILLCSYCSNGAGWPAFWSVSVNYATGQIPAGAPYPELDFMEYYTQPSQSPWGQTGYTSTYTTNVHQFSNTTPVSQVQDLNVPRIPSNTDFGTWHTYGCLWTPNKVQWYFDNKLVATVATGPGTSFNSLEQNKMFLILGTGMNWPMYVDYVHVWQ